MQEIADMTERMVRKAKEYDRDNVPGDYATLTTPCPKCGGVVKENYRRYACAGANGNADGCGFSFGKTPGGRTFELVEVEQFLRDKRIGPLQGFRSKAGWPFSAEMALVYNEDDQNWKLEFDFGDDKNQDSGEIVDLSQQPVLGACPKCGSAVREHGSNYVCEKSVPTEAQITPSCDFKTGKIILQQPVSTEQITKLLGSGKTDLLTQFVSMRTRRPFKAFLAYDAEQGKVVFEFEPRTSKFPPRKTAARPATGAAAKATGKTAAGKTPAKKAPAKKTTVKKERQPRAGNLSPSSALQAVIGQGLVSRPEVTKKLWDYIKAQGLQDPKDKRTILADDKLRAVFGKDSVTMFEIAKLIGPHLS
jgi:DNA topoisomerase-3